MTTPLKTPCKLSAYALLAGLVSVAVTGLGLAEMPGSGSSSYTHSQSTQTTTPSQTPMQQTDMQKPMTMPSSSAPATEPMSNQPGSAQNMNSQQPQPPDTMSGQDMTTPTAPSATTPPRRTEGRSTVRGFW